MADRKAYLKEYDHRPERLAKKRERHMKNRTRANIQRRANLYRNYGITIEDYNRMFILQNGVCAICNKPEKHRRLSVDHHHGTGKVRALLCHTCNMNVGFAEGPMRNAVDDYIKRYA